LDAIRTILRTLGANQRGATAIEYGLIAALIVIAMMAGLSAMGGGIGGMWGLVGTKVSTAMPSS
jgi:pilus assembly protein Flp/PilA